MLVHNNDYLKMLTKSAINIWKTESSQYFHLLIKRSPNRIIKRLTCLHETLDSKNIYKYSIQ